MKTCETCRWWRESDSPTGSRVTHPTDPDTYEPMVMPWDVRQCACPRIRFYERPVERNEACVIDGSEYSAGLCTGPDFGCVLHEEA